MFVCRLKITDPPKQVAASHNVGNVVELSGVLVANGTLSTIMVDNGVLNSCDLQRKTSYGISLCVTIDILDRYSKVLCW
jgi:hypothetical protein